MFCSGFTVAIYGVEGVC